MKKSISDFTLLPEFFIPRPHFFPLLNIYD